MQSGEDYPVRYTVPMHLHVRLINAIGRRAMQLVGEMTTRKTLGAVTSVDGRALRQARNEALQEAIEDWLAKPKSEKWL